MDSFRHFWVTSVYYELGRAELSFIHYCIGWLNTRSFVSSATHQRIRFHPTLCPNSNSVEYSQSYLTCVEKERVPFLTRTMSNMTRTAIENMRYITLYR
jgi:hypothetical protein